SRRRGHCRLRRHHRFGARARHSRPAALAGQPEQGGVMPDMTDPERLLDAVGTVAAHVDSGDHVWTEAVLMAEALDPLLSVVGSGGRLVVETPCEHGVFHDSCDQLVCGHDHLLTDGWYPDAKAECWCPGGSRRQVWPTDKETA